MIFGRKKSKAKKEAGELAGDGELLAPPIEIKQMGVSREEAQGLTIAARQLPGYPLAMIVIVNAISGRADRIHMDFSVQGAVVRYRIDGVWETLPPMDRSSADAALVAMKKLLGLNPAERRAKQEAKFGTNFQKTDWIVSFTSVGVPNGERVLISIDTKKPVFKTLEDLGMRESMIKDFLSYMNGNKGLVIISSPPTHGLPTLWRVALENTDKFVRDFVSLEDKNDPEPEIINVTPFFYDSATEPPLATLSKLLLKQPDVFVMPSLVDEDVVEAIYDQVTVHSKHAITRISGTDCVDALLQVLRLYPKQAKNILKMTSAVLCGRLVRRLCDKCKQPYQPNPQLLQRLGVPAGRITKLYNPTIPPPPEQRVDANGKPIEIEICKKCNGRGYYGRMAIFELLKLDDDLKKVVIKYVNEPDKIRAFAKQRNHLGFQEEGIAACALGHTSLQEIQKMLTGK
jgi:type II secretory ATPase GspE/PulE/Tfp pilus assembly ATPase PilB-like protein